MKDLLIERGKKEQNQHDERNGLKAMHVLHNLKTLSIGVAYLLLATMPMDTTAIHLREGNQQLTGYGPGGAGYSADANGTEGYDATTTTTDYASNTTVYVPEVEYIPEVVPEKPHGSTAEGHGETGGVPDLMLPYELYKKIAAGTWTYEDILEYWPHSDCHSIPGWWPLKEVNLGKVDAYLKVYFAQAVEVAGEYYAEKGDVKKPATPAGGTGTGTGHSTDTKAPEKATEAPTLYVEPSCPSTPHSKKEIDEDKACPNSEYRKFQDRGYCRFKGSNKVGYHIERCKNFGQDRCACEALCSSTKDCVTYEFRKHTKDGWVCELHPEKPKYTSSGNGNRYLGCYTLA